MHFEMKFFLGNFHDFFIFILWLIAMLHHWYGIFLWCTTSSLSSFDNLLLSRIYLIPLYWLTKIKLLWHRYSNNINVTMTTMVLFGAGILLSVNHFVTFFRTMVRREKCAGILQKFDPVWIWSISLYWASFLSAIACVI